MPHEPVVNDFVLKFGNVNGSGSASANLMCAKAIFRMGVPVSAKNVFPSNIQGLPTWYEVRISESGHLGRRDGVDLMIAMNPASYLQDVMEVSPGGTVLYDSTMERDFGRSDITVIGIPIARICARHWADPRQRQLFKNMVYVGALIELIGLEGDVLERLVTDQFRGKASAIEPNVKALHLGRDWAREHIAERPRVRVERRNLTDGKIMIQGNEAAGIGALFAGATVASWYPITPSTSLVEAFEKHAQNLRRNPDGTLNAAIIQAEDELAAVGMAIGASWNGARAFTATSGPGISLMTEFIGLAYFAEIPLVLFDIQRGGPSTGMPTRTQQSDLLACAYASHGDTCHILLLPSDPGECFTMAADAFDIADRYQTPVFVMSDLDIGMNDWVVDELTWDDARLPDRGKLLDAEALEAAAGFARYRDVDGDGIPHRTVPGTHPTRGAFFTRGTSHTETGGYTEDGTVNARNLERIHRKVQSAAAALPAPVIRDRSDETQFAIVNFGSTEPAVEEAIELMEAEGRVFSRIRIRAFPFAEAVAAVAAKHDLLFVVEQNRDAQMRHLLIVEAGIPAEKLVAVTNHDGMPLTADFVKGATTNALRARRGPEAVPNRRIPAE